MKKKFLYITLGLCIALGMGACSTEKEGKPNDKDVANEGLTDASEKDNDNKIENESTESTGRYESETLEVHDVNEELKDIGEVKSYNGDLYILSRGELGIYTYKYDKLVDVDTDCIDIIKGSSKGGLLKKEDGSLVNFYTSGDEVYSYSVEIGEGDYFLAGDHIFVENGKLYYNGYFQDEDGAYTLKYKNLDVIARQFFDDDDVVTEDVKSIYQNSIYRSYLVMEDGLVYGETEHNLNKDKGYFNYYVLSPILENVDNIFADDVIEYGRPLHSLKNVEGALYTYQIGCEKTGIPSENFRIELKLPEGYKVSDIKDVVYEEAFILEFADGTICTAERIRESTQLTINEEISKLNEEGHVLGYGCDYDGVVFLMDDGKLYTFE